MDIASIGAMYKRIDHIAIAVNDLNAAIFYYRNILGFELTEQRETKGNKSGMLSAVMSSSGFNIVLVQGTEPESQVSRYIDAYGMGVQHVAFEVDAIEVVIDELEKRGIVFATGIISSPGLKQIFSERDSSSGMMIELIERCDHNGFEDKSVQELFDQLESLDLV